MDQPAPAVAGIIQPVYHQAVGGAAAPFAAFPAAVYAAPVVPPPKKTPAKKKSAPAAARVAAHAAPAAGFYGAAPVHPAAYSMPGPAERNEDYAELIEAAKATIEGYREDGPVLGFVFDRPAVSVGVKRSLHDRGEVEEHYQPGKVGAGACLGAGSCIMG